MKIQSDLSFQGTKFNITSRNNWKPLFEVLQYNWIIRYQLSPHRNVELIILLFNIALWRFIYFYQLKVDKLLSVSVASRLIVSSETDIAQGPCSYESIFVKKRIVT